MDGTSVPSISGVTSVQGNKKYSVVKFIIDQTFSEIPTSWLVDDGKKQLCMWPPRTANAANCIVNCTTPNFDTWTMYEVDLIKTCSSLECARKSAADSNYETTDDDRLGRGKRQHLSHNRYSSEDEENDNLPSRSCKKKAAHANKVVSILPPCPDNLTIDSISNYEGINVKSINVAKKDIQSSRSSGEKRKTCTNAQDIQFYADREIPVIFEDCAPLYGEIAEESSTVIKYLKQVIRMQATLNLTVQDMKERLSRMEDVMKNRACVSNNNDNLIAHLLPLNTIKAIQDFDLLLGNTEEAVKQFISFLLRSGGNNPRDNIQRILPKIFTNECAMKCSWKGIRNNFKVANLYIIKIMRREITLHHSSLTECVFDSIVAEWLRFAKQRKEREEKQAEDRENNEESEH